MEKEEKVLEVSDSIGKEMKLEFTGSDHINSLIKFNLTDKDGNTEKLEVSLGWWASKLQYYDWDNFHQSGMYTSIFMEG